jgi:non-reducing end alpha-L-arabinofuranosidase
MKNRTRLLLMLAAALALPPAALIIAQQVGAGNARPQGPCDVYAAAQMPCVAAHSSTRALFAAYNGPLYQIMRQTDGKKLDIGVVPPNAIDGGGYADAAAQDAFCAHTYCWITTVYDQSGHKNDLIQAPRGGTGVPTMMGGFNSLPLADMAPVTLMGHKVYGVYIEPGMGLRNNNPHGTAVDDQAQGQYWVVNGHHYNSGCCYDYGNAEIDSRDDGEGTMETTYFGNAFTWYHGPDPGPWIMTDQENNLVGCVNDNPQDKLCRNLPVITWRFVTAMAKGEPHHWASMGGDAQGGELKVMFDGKRVDNRYDPMRKQGAIVLGNGGDNSNSSQGTFYEGAMTAPNTFPTNDTDQKVQANVVAAKYGAQRLAMVPASAAAKPPGLQTFVPGSSQDTLVTFVNTSAAPVKNVSLKMTLPAGWNAVAAGGGTEVAELAPGASFSATFKVTSGPAAFNGDLVAHASWAEAAGRMQADTVVEKVRNASPIKINEFAGQFIELYNAGDSAVDLSNWSVTQHPIQQATFSAIQIPAGTKLASHGFYLLGMAGSGLAVPANQGDSTVYARSIAGMKEGGSIQIGVGASAETRKIAKLGSAAGSSTTLWQPLPDGPVITIPAGSTRVPVERVNGFAVGQKAALGYGATYPIVGKDLEKYEIVTVTEIGKAGAQTALAADAKAGDTSIRLRNGGSVSVGDTINLDIDSVGHGNEKVIVKSIGGAPGAPGAPGAQAPVANEDGTFFVAAPAAPGGAAPQTPGAPGGAGRGTRGGLGGPGGRGGGGGGGGVIELTAPLKFNHASNLPVSVWGTGIKFQPASAQPHSSNEPVLPLGTGITLDKPLDQAHDIDTVVRVEASDAGGYQGTAKPDQWFGGPVIGSLGVIILRDAGGLVADSLNYGGTGNNGAIGDPWAAEGYQGTSVALWHGCFVPTPMAAGGGGGRGGAGRAGGGAGAAGPGSSAGRTRDGVDTDSNCTDFVIEAPTPGAPNKAAQ